MSGSIKQAAVAVLMLFSATGIPLVYSDEPASTGMQYSIPIATLDVERVFKKSEKHNAAMAPLQATFDEPSNRNRGNKALGDEMIKVKAETYQRMVGIVTHICKTKNIGIVIRAKLDSSDAADRPSILQYVNRPVVYSVVPDITDEVIAGLDR